MYQNEKEILKFKDDIKRLQKKVGIDNLFDSLYITSSGRIGYIERCSECGCICLNDSDIYIPLKNFNHMSNVVDEYGFNFLNKENLINDEIDICLCNDEDYEFMDNKWIYVGDIEDFDC